MLLLPFMYRPLGEQSNWFISQEVCLVNRSLIVCSGFDRPYMASQCTRQVQRSASPVGDVPTVRVTC